MKMLLSLTLAVLMSVTPVLASIGLGTTAAHAQAGRITPLSVPVLARVTPEGGTPSDVSGTLTITRFVARDNEAVAVGNLTIPTATGAMVMPVAMNVVRGTAQLTQQATPAQITQQATCQILNLTLAPLTLNLLGLVVEIPNPVCSEYLRRAGRWESARQSAVRDHGAARRYRTYRTVGRSAQ
jgi:hypothetical protein